jgi:hypothetical protein
VSRSLIAEGLGLKEGRDYKHICMGEDGFTAAGLDLSEHVSPDNKTYRPAQYCDISAQTFTVTRTRIEQQGLQFSRPTYKGYMVRSHRARFSHLLLHLCTLLSMRC